MKRKQGFTLVELLVVMAIISILASIAIPKIINNIEKAKVTKAVSEIRNIDLALTSMIADSQVSNLGQLLNPDTVRAYIFNAPGTANQSPGHLVLTRQAFQRALELYTRLYYALLREGRQALADSDSQLDVNFPQQYINYLNANAVKKLGTGYMPDLAFDPWKINLYQIYPGPWPSAGLLQDGSRPQNPVPFRIYTIDTSAGTLPGTRAGGSADVLTFKNQYNIDLDLTETWGYAPPRDSTVFIYSLGKNLVSGQALYTANGYPLSTPGNPSDYYLPQEDTLKGGGDDINSWDKDGSWGRHYN